MNFVSDRSNSSVTAIYNDVIAEVFRRMRIGKSSEYGEFTKTDIENVVDDLLKTGQIAKTVKNIPDIKYTYDARRDFPISISSSGHWCIIGLGKSRYAFQKLTKNNLIRLPADLPVKPRFISFQDITPKLVSSVLGDDEQATFARVRYNDLLGKFLSLKVDQVQSHERTTVSAGQIEVDEVYVGEDAAGKTYVIPISGKGGEKDCLSYSQVFNLNLYATEKRRYKGLIPIPVGIVRKNDGTIWCLRFSDEVKVTDISIVDAVGFRSV